MTYHLGIDLGTTYTAAAVLRRGQARIEALGATTDTIPSVVLLRADETLLTGEAALRRGATEPHRLAREFKRRFGQPEPILLGGTPYSPEALTARLLRSVVEAVVEREGSQPERICLTHPANWGPFKRDLFEHVVRLAEIRVPVTYVTEPEAAAVAYAREQRVEPGAVVAVYDLGGGTFDAAVLRRGDDGFEILGRPEGIEQLGGIDVDAAVFHHVTAALGSALEELDEDDPVAIAGVARLRRDCVEAKEALSSDTDVSIPVVLPSVSTQVRLTREELERMVRPMLGGTVEALGRALDSAHVTAADVSSVLLVGGSSRMPLVAQLVGAELGRPVVVDAHPKHVVALGAAWCAGDDGGLAPAAPPVPTGPVAEPVAAPTAPTDPPREHPGLPAVSTTPTTQTREEATQPDLAAYSSMFAETAPSADTAPISNTMPAAESPPPPPLPPTRSARRGHRGRNLVLLALVLVAVAAGAFFAVQQLRADDPPASGADQSEDQAPASPLEQLESIADDDLDQVRDILLDEWAPQLDVFVDDVRDQDGVTYDNEKILAKYEELAAEHDLLLVRTGDFPASFSIGGGWAPMVAMTFDSADDVLEWCAGEDVPPDDCFAKRISESGEPPDNIKMADR